MSQRSVTHHRESTTSRKRYVLGVDGGGSRSLLSVYDIHGDHVISLPGESLNHEGLPQGFTDVRHRLCSFLDRLAESTGILPDQIEVSTFGISGIDTPHQERELLMLVRELGFSRSMVCNDAFLGIHALPSSCYGPDHQGSTETSVDEGDTLPRNRQRVHRWGICSIQGTGCTTVGIDQTGRPYRLGGFGDLSRDCGGSHQLTRRLFASIYDAEFRGGPATIMRDLVYQRLSVSTRDEFIQAVVTGLGSTEQRLTEMHATPSSPLSLNSIVFEAARESDCVASHILTRVGESIGRDIVRIVQEWQPDPGMQIPVVLAGSLHVHERENLAIRTLRRYVLDELPHVRFGFHYLEKSPVVGAVAWSLIETGHPEAAERILGEA